MKETTTPFYIISFITLSVFSYKVWLEQLNENKGWRIVASILLAIDCTVAIMELLIEGF
jgi:hypothetical protein